MKVINLFLHLIGIDIISDEIEQRTENYLNKSKKQQENLRAIIK